MSNKFDVDEYPTNPQTATATAEASAAEIETAAAEASAPPPNSQPKPKRRGVLRLALYAAGAIIVLAGLLYGGWSVYRYNSSFPITNPGLPAEKIGDYQVNPEPAPSSSQIETAATPKNVSEFTDAAPGTFAAQPQDNAKLLAEIRDVFEEMQEPSARFETQLQAVLELEASVVSLINIQSVFFESVEDRLQAIEDELQTLTTQNAPAQASTVPDQSPPFRLVGIDRWNNAWNAVILFDNKMTMLEPNDTRAEWTLVSLDAKKRQARFVHAEGGEAVLTVDQ